MLLYSLFSSRDLSTAAIMFQRHGWVHQLHFHRSEFPLRLLQDQWAILAPWADICWSARHLLLLGLIRLSARHCPYRSRFRRPVMGDAAFRYTVLSVQFSRPGWWVRQSIGVARLGDQSLVGAHGP